MREKAIADYHAWLAADGELTADLFARLRAEMRARRLVYGGREVGVALRPHLLTGAQYGALARSAEVLCGAFDRLTEAFVAEPALADSLGLTDAECRLALLDPGLASPFVTTRLDAFLSGDQIKFVEYNAENPSSLTDQEGLNRILFEVRAMQALAGRYRLRDFSPTRALLEALLEAWAEWGGRGAPRVAIVDWAGLPTAGEFELLREHFDAYGVPTIVCDPDEMEYAGGRLRAGDFRVDLVYKRVIIHELLGRRGEDHPLVRAYANRDVCLVNPFRCKAAHKKAAFELLTDEGRGGWFTAPQREVIRRTVPWTRRFYERRTRYGGGTVDLVEFVRDERARFVLKPNDDYGGSGVLIGARASASEWDAMIGTALAGDYVVQEAVEVPVEEFPLFGDETWGLQPVYVDTNPFLFRGRVEGAFVRLSASPVVNVTSGGGETGFFVVEGEARR